MCTVRRSQNQTESKPSHGHHEPMLRRLWRMSSEVPVSVNGRVLCLCARTYCQSLIKSNYHVNTR